MISVLDVFVVGLALIGFTFISYFLKVRVKSYLRFMITVDLMVLIPLILIVSDLTDSFVTYGILATVIIGLLYMGFQYNDLIGYPYKRMFASMVRAVDNKNLDIEGTISVDFTGEMQQLQSKQITFVREVKDMIRQISQSQANLDGYLSHMDDQSNKLKSEISNVTDDVDQILQNAAVISEQVYEIKTRSTDFIDETDSKFELLMEIANSADRITDQTNIIAVNAAIEATQSETDSVNFSTVADSIQSLSRRSRDTTDKLQSSINQLRRSIGKELQSLNNQLEQLEDAIFDMGELANRSSSYIHEHKSYVDELRSIQNQAENESDAIGKQVNIYRD